MDIHPLVNNILFTSVISQSWFQLTCVFRTMSGINNIFLPVLFPTVSFLANCALEHQQNQRSFAVTA